MDILVTRYTGQFRGGQNIVWPHEFSVYGRLSPPGSASGQSQNMSIFRQFDVLFFNLMVNLMSSNTIDSNLKTAPIDEFSIKPCC